jgi:hypothetical protein
MATGAGLGISSGLLGPWRELIDAGVFGRFPPSRVNGLSAAKDAAEEALVVSYCPRQHETTNDADGAPMVPLFTSGYSLIELPFGSESAAHTHNLPSFHDVVDVADKAVVDSYCRRHNMRLVTEKEWAELHAPTAPTVVEPPAHVDPVFNALAVNDRAGGLLNFMRHEPIVLADFDSTE